MTTPYSATAGNTTTPAKVVSKPIAVFDEEAQPVPPPSIPSPPRGPLLSVQARYWIKAILAMATFAVLVWVIDKYRPRSHRFNDQDMAKLIAANLTFASGVEMIAALVRRDTDQSSPFTLAISQGFKYIDVDVWLSNGVLLVGETEQDLASDRTLSGMYLKPLEMMLDARNNATQMEEGIWNGIYKNTSDEFGLMVDIHSQPVETYNRLLVELAPLISKGYLTSYLPSNKIWKSGPLRLLGTGSTPLFKIMSAEPRHVFYDVNLMDLNNTIAFANEDGTSNATNMTWDNTIAAMASAHLPQKYQYGLLAADHYNPPVPISQLQITAFAQPWLKKAKELDIPSRLFDIFVEPARVERLWGVQKVIGVEVLNVQDLVDLRKWLLKWNAGEVYVAGEEGP